MNAIDIIIICIVISLLLYIIPKVFPPIGRIIDKDSFYDMITGVNIIGIITIIIAFNPLCKDEHEPAFIKTSTGIYVETLKSKTRRKNIQEMRLQSEKQKRGFLQFLKDYQRNKPQRDKAIQEVLKQHNVK